MDHRTRSVELAGRAPRRLVILALAVVVVGATWAQGSANDLKIRRSRATGLASFVTAANGGAITVQPAAGRSRAQPMDFLVQYGHLFGLTDPANQTAPAKTETDAIGYTHTTYAQVHAGVPVFSGVVKVHQDAAGGFVAANGDFYPSAGKIGTQPTLDPAAAMQVAESVLLRDAADVSHCELVIVDPGWYGDPPRGPRLAYYIIRTNWAAAIRRAFFVDAHTGAILDQWSMIHGITGRLIYDAHGGSSLPGTCMRVEGAPPIGDPEVDAAYDYAGDTLNYYERAFGRDGVADTGGNTIVSVNYGYGCPNAFWNGEQLIFCPGTVTDDILGHEFTHGVTEFTANLIYQNQPGQLNESFSDVFGELIDLFNGNAAFPGSPGGTPWPTESGYGGSGTDTPNNLRSDECSWPWYGYADGLRWLTGEDAGAFGGAIRDMWDPTCFGDPDRAYSPLQTCNPDDGGGVHSGSGIPNHAFAMVTDGKTFNGYTVEGLGPIKSGAVWYLALSQYLTPAADFEEAYAAFNQAALVLLGSYPNDPRTGAPSTSVFTEDDAAQVDLALRAVEMDGPGLCGQVFEALDSDPPPECTSLTIIFEDDFEAGTNGWTVFNSGPPTPYNWVQTTDLPSERPDRAWFGEDRNVGDCGPHDESGWHALVSPVVHLPTSLNFPVLAFTHYVEVENGWDGGNLKLSVDGAAWQLVPAAAFYYNPYNATPLVGLEGDSANPLAGQPGFTGASGGWGTSLVYLGDFVSGGESLRFRFDFGKDGCTGYTGWFVDDFQLFDCNAAQDCNHNGVPDDVELAEGPQVNLVLQNLPQPVALAVSDADPDGLWVEVHAEDFTVDQPTTIRSIKLWGAYYPNNNPLGNDFTVIFHEYSAGRPGATLATETYVPCAQVQTGNLLLGFLNEWEITLSLSAPVHLDVGSYFVEIYNNTQTTEDTFLWESADYGGIPQHAFAYEAPGLFWGLADFALAIEIHGGIIGGDCNSNGILDVCDVASGVGQDCEDNGVLDECEFTDCNTNTIHDGCDIAAGTSCDCNANRIPDECDLAEGTSGDCDDNGVLDECELADCNTNTIHDGCDIAAGTSQDCDLTGVPDECEFVDCNTNGIYDGCDVVDGTSDDCNTNRVPDECDVVGGASADCDSNGVPDECEFVDCNTNGVYDACELLAGTSPDVNSNGVPDECDECLVASECDDGVFCNGQEPCDAGVCAAGANPCPGQACQEASKACFTPPPPPECGADAGCDDGQFCTGAETCSGGYCVVGADPCPSQPCDEVDDVCVDCLTDAHCLDGLYCNGEETCAADGTCQAGTPPCPAQMVCDEDKEECVECLVDRDCDDGDQCTIDSCVGQVCAYAVIPVCPDADGDGLVDDLDLCGNTPTGAVIDADGCACSQLDDDGDGVNNCDDQCSDTPRGQDVDDVGCPVEVPPPEPPPEDGANVGAGEGPAREGVTGPGGVSGAAGNPIDEPAAMDPVPEEGAGPGASPEGQEQSDDEPSRDRGSRPGSGICGVLGAVNLAFLVASLAGLQRRRWR